MITVSDQHGEAHTGRTVLAIARRLYGRRASVAEYVGHFGEDAGRIYAWDVIKHTAQGPIEVGSFHRVD
jgi:hypothetical protein